MSVDETKKIDFTALDRGANEMQLVIADHLPWGGDEREHLYLLQEKLNAYLAFIESGEIYDKVPNAKGRKLVIMIVGKFSLSEGAKSFLERAFAVVERAGFQLRFDHRDGEVRLGTPIERSALRALADMRSRR
jgi:hypothetical protein